MMDASLLKLFIWDNVMHPALITYSHMLQKVTISALAPILKAEKKYLYAGNYVLQSIAFRSKVSYIFNLDIQNSY